MFLRRTDLSATGKIWCSAGVMEEPDPDLDRDRNWKKQNNARTCGAGAEAPTHRRHFRREACARAWAAMRICKGPSGPFTRAPVRVTRASGLLCAGMRQEGVFSAVGPRGYPVGSDSGSSTRLGLLKLRDGPNHYGTCFLDDHEMII